MAQDKDKDQETPPPPEGISRKQMSAVLSHFGFYQRRLFLLIIPPLIMSGYKTMSVVLTFVSPPHRCQVPGLANDTFAIQNEAHRMLVNLSIPMTSIDGDVSYSQCDVYKDRGEQYANRTLYDETEPCDSWVYDKTDFDNTVVTQFDLVCDQKGFRANFNMVYMLGMLFGGPISGVLCDRIGRKKVFLISVTLAIVVSVAAAFPVITPMLLVYRFTIAALGTGLYIPLYVLCLEFMGTEQRTVSGSLMMALWVLGPLTVGALSYLLKDWRWLQVLNGAPFVLCLSYWWIFDESPRWLLAKGRVKEAREVILKVMKANKITMPPDNQDDGDTLRMEAMPQRNTPEGHLAENHGHARNDRNADTAGDAAKEGKAQPESQQTRDAESKAEGETDREIPPESIWKMFKYPNLIARSGIIFLNWSAISTTYYGLSLNVSNLGGNIRLNFFLSTLVELVGYSAAWFLLDRLGRKRTHCAVMLLSGTSCLATIFSVMFGGSDLHWVTILLVMMGKMGISAAFNTVYLLSGELFPTVIRNRGMSASSTVARMATALSPYIADLSLHMEGSVGRALPLVIFGALALTAGLLALCLPETLHRKLPDTILEAANFTKKKRDENVNVQQQRK